MEKNINQADSELPNQRHYAYTWRPHAGTSQARVMQCGHLRSKKILACMPYAPDRVQDFVLAVLSQPELFGSQNHTFTGERGHVIDFFPLQVHGAVKKVMPVLNHDREVVFDFLQLQGNGRFGLGPTHARGKGACVTNE